MGRISDIIPPLYYDSKNDLIRYIDCFDVEVKELEQKIKGLTDLVNIDKCPDDKLPYLAALTNCPLMGTDPILWRNQIRNWPYLLKIKGTALSLDVFLHLIDVDEHKLYTFFRDSEGNLIENKPEGEPFEKDGLWYNIRTHYFDLDIIYNEGHYLTWTEWHDDFLRSINIWLTRLKPFHAELRNLDVYLKREDDLHIYIGTLGTEGVHYKVSYDWNFSADDVNNISVEIANNQGAFFDVNYSYNFNSDDTNEFSVNVATNQGAYYNIDYDKNYSVQDSSSVITENVFISGIYHEIGR